MSDKKYTTIQQHEPLRVPPDWSASGRRLVAQLEEIFDDLYRRFNRIKLSDLGDELQTSIRKVDKIELRVEDMENNPPVATELRSSAVTIDKDGITISGGEVNVEAGSAVRIRSDSVFELESENFSVSPEGRVSMQNAEVSGNLSQDGYRVLTQRDIIISSTEPDGIANRIWVKPLSNVALTYLHSVATGDRFSVYNTAHELILQGSPVTADAVSYRYTMRIPYKVVGGPPTAVREVTAVVQGAFGSAVTLTGSLQNAAGFVGTVELTGEASFWLGDSSRLSFTITLNAGGTSSVYDYHRVTSGSIELLCTAISGSVNGWTSAEIRIYQ